MNLIQLKSFATVAKLGSFTKAAERLHLSQPAISGHIRRLEDELGVALFTRGHRTVALTEQGRLLLEHVEAVLFEMDRMLLKAREVAKLPRRAMRLGFVVGTEAVRMTPLLGEVGRSLPHIRMDVAQGLSGWVAAGVENGRFDAGFFLGLSRPSGLDALEVTRLRYFLCLPASWNERVHNPSPVDLTDLPWVWAPEGASYREVAREMLQRHNLSPRQAIEADREATIADLVANSLGVAILREPLARANAAADKVVVLEDYAVDVPLYFLTRKDADPDVASLRQTVKKVFDLA